MLMKRATLCLLIGLSAGCTSFRTTALYRCDNDSVVPECTNQKLKGLPVKLKVPSHVRVTIYEQQIIIANTSADVAAAKEVADNSAIVVQSLQDKIDGNPKEFALATAAVEAADAAVTKYTNEEDTETDPGKKSKAKIKKNQAIGAQKLAILRLGAAEGVRDSLPELLLKLVEAKDHAAQAAANAVIGYKLVSFTPQQLVVETDLQYTDKVFLVDFRRPAAGMLNLNEASMDDEQYFSKIQADVTERTLKDVGAALNTLKGPLTPKKPAQASTTSANTPDGQGNSNVNFQKSVVASQRFDISEPDWEARMEIFIDNRLNSQNGTPVAPVVDFTPAPATQFGGNN